MVICSIRLLLILPHNRLARSSSVLFALPHTIILKSIYWGHARIICRRKLGGSNSNGLLYHLSIHISRCHPAESIALKQRPYIRISLKSSEKAHKPSEAYNGFMGDSRPLSSRTSCRSAVSGHIPDRMNLIIIIIIIIAQHEQRSQIENYMHVMPVTWSGTT